MKHYGVFDIIGPIMVGPSSSHTAGAARLGLLGRHLCGEDVKKAYFYMHGSFAETYAGHGTDKALLAGIQGIRYDDERLKQAYELAAEKDMEVHFIPADLGEDQHPNTVKMELTTVSGRTFTMTGCSIGGGSVCITEIDGVTVRFSGERPILATRHTDEPGVIAGITAILYAYRINIGNMQVNRNTNGEACMYMELDGELPDQLKGALERVYGIRQVLLLNPGDIA